MAPIASDVTHRLRWMGTLHRRKRHSRKNSYTDWNCQPTKSKYLIPLRTSNLPCRPRAKVAEDLGPHARSDDHDNRDHEADDLRDDAWHDGNDADHEPGHERHDDPAL